MDYILDNAFIHIELVNGIMIGYYKPGLKIDTEDVMLIVSERITFFNKKSYPLLIEDKGVVSMSKEAREYLSSDAGIQGIKAAAIVMHSVFSVFLANFFLKVSVNKPKVPTQLFTDQSKALKWLNKFK